MSTERRVRSLHSRIVVRATTDTTDQRRQLIQFYSLTKHNLQTTHNPAGATARTAIRLTRATQSPLRNTCGQPTPNVICTRAGLPPKHLTVEYTLIVIPSSASRGNRLQHACWTESYTTVSLTQAFPRLP